MAWGQLNLEASPADGRPIIKQPRSHTSRSSSSIDCGREFRKSSVASHCSFSRPTSTLQKCLLRSQTSSNSSRLLEGRMLHVRVPAICERFTDLYSVAARIKKSTKTHNIKFKVRCNRYLYTLILKDSEKADKLKQSLPPSMSKATPESMEETPY